MKKLALLLAIMVLAISLSGCTQNNQQSPENNQNSEELLRDTSIKALGALQNKNMGYLSTLAHPEKGIRFTPYSYINLENDVVLSASEIKNILADSRSFVWGVYDGIGEPIDLPFMDYFDKFVYDRDFMNAEETSKNRSIGSGNTINNIETVYPNAEYFEYHFPGFNPEYGGMDWVSLRLVFEEYKGAWYLVGIVHDQWTI